MNFLDIGFFLLIGSMTGTLAGMLGIGGGIIYVPVLVWFLERNGFHSENIPVVAVSTSLAIILTSIFNSSYQHWKNGNLSLKSIPWLALGGTGAAIPASMGLSKVDSKTFLLAFGVFLFFVGFKMFRGTVQKSKEERKENNEEGPKHYTVLTGFLSGALSAFFGVGGGIVTVPMLHFLGKLRMSRAVGTSCGFMIFVTGISLASYLYQSRSIENLPKEVFGSVYLPAYLAIVPTAFLFNRFGANLAHKIDGTKLKRLFSLLILLVALYNCSKFFL